MSASRSSEGERPADVPAGAEDVVVSAWFPRAIAAPDSARNRAQAGYAISSAIASSVVAVGAFVDIADRSVEAQLFAGLALLCWVATALLFLHAVTTAVNTPIADSEAQADSSGWLLTVLRRSQDERDLVDRRQKRASLATVIAVAVTVPALILTLGSSVSLDKDRVSLSLSDKGLAAVTALCKKKPREIRGALESRTLRREFVVIELDADLCQPNVANVRIPRAEVLGVASER
jgi:hypothetical protein